ncbi:hypothetical protein SAMN02745121_09045, partial [Nannocystis exedens]
RGQFTSSWTILTPTARTRYAPLSAMTRGASFGAGLPCTILPSTGVGSTLPRTRRAYGHVNALDGFGSALSPNCAVERLCGTRTPTAGGGRSLGGSPRSKPERCSESARSLRRGRSTSSLESVRGSVASPIGRRAGGDGPRPACRGPDDHQREGDRRLRDRRASHVPAGPDLDNVVRRPGRGRAGRGRVSQEHRRGARTRTRYTRRAPGGLPTRAALSGPVVTGSRDIGATTRAERRSDLRRYCQHRRTCHPAFAQ